MIEQGTSPLGGSESSEFRSLEFHRDYSTVLVHSVAFQILKSSILMEYLAE